MSKRWRRVEGAYGHKVAVFERAGRGSLYVKYTDPQTGKLVQRALGHAEQERAIEEAQGISNELRRARVGSPLPSAGPAMAERTDITPVLPEPTLVSLLARYRREVSPTKRHPAPAEDKRRARIWRYFFRLNHIVFASELDQPLLDKFTRLRLHGDLQVPGVELRPPAPPSRTRERRAFVVSHRTVDADHVFLTSVLNWARRKKTSGNRHLLQVSTPKVRVRSRSRPRRTTASHDEHRRLLQIADTVDSTRRFGCFLRLLDNYGWRVTAICHIRASDFDFRPAANAPYGQLRKNELVDKTEAGDWLPLSRHARATAERLLRVTELTTQDHAFVFTQQDGSTPWNRWHFRDFVNRARRRGVQACVSPHAWRRKFATERKHLPDQDVMRVGGWKDIDTYKNAYAMPDAATTLEVITRPRRLRDPS